MVKITALKEVGRVSSTTTLLIKNQTIRKKNKRLACIQEGKKLCQPGIQVILFSCRLKFSMKNVYMKFLKKYFEFVDEIFQ